ncbi:MAG TPA: hypothetical protein VFG43_05805, partial [Geminicoccaceae bacterium]|nr:hypothetical protein [Geminicoccaceae bacterium]
ERLARLERMAVALLEQGGEEGDGRPAEPVDRAARLSGKVLEQAAAPEPLGEPLPEPQPEPESEPAPMPGPKAAPAVPAAWLSADGLATAAADPEASPTVEARLYRVLSAEPQGP